MPQPFAPAAAICAICGHPVKEKSRWNEADAFCWGCRNFICFECHIKGPGVIRSGPHTLDLHRQRPKPEDPHAAITIKEEEQMPIMISAGQSKKYTPAPAGLHNGICVDVVDLGMEPNKFDSTNPDVHKIRIIWEIEETDPENGNKRFTVAAKFTASIHPKASLRKFLVPWRGRDFTADEGKAFDVEKLVGVPCLIQVIHNAGEDGQVYANVVSVLPPQNTTQKLKASKTYVRVKDRPAKDDAVAAIAPTAPPPAR